jgi:hypothetical protein
MQKHIELLLKAEKETATVYGGFIRFNRVADNVLSVSCRGYNHMDLDKVTGQLLALGLRYDFKRGVEKFDKISGRTYTFFKEKKD